MAGPFAEGGVVMEFETNEPMDFVQFEPSNLPTDVWFHRRESIAADGSVEQIVDEFVLPESDSYRVRLIEVPAGETLQMGTLAGIDNRSGGGDLVQLLSRDAIPDDWVQGWRRLEELI